MRTSTLKAFFAAVIVALLSARGVLACPFCSVETQTLAEETRGADAVVLAKLLKEAPANANPADPNSGTATFKVVEVLHGDELLKGAKEISVVFFGDNNPEKTYLINGIGKDKVDWTTPLPLSAAAIKYVKQLKDVPPAGADRLAFFQDYLENEDPLLSQDAYEEFARAPYSELRDLKPRMQHERIVSWVTDPEVSPSRRRLYLTMLGICGSKADVPMLESMIASDFDTMNPMLEQVVKVGQLMGGPVGLPVWIDAVQQEERRKKLGLDALVACYLILRGPDGMDLVENRFLKNPHAEYTHVYSTIMALRFHGDENTGVIPRDRLLGAMRLLLNNRDFADQVILDLSRWEDWSVLDRMVEMFKKSDEKGYVRQPVVSYLTVASDQPGEIGVRAKAAVAELEKLDPETVKTARQLMAFGALGRARGVAAAASASGTAAKPQPAGDAALATTSSTDTKQGFAASESDNKTDSKSIPDPATYESEPQKQDPSVAKQSPAAEAKTQGNQVAAAVTPAAVSQGDPQKNATQPAAAPAVSARMNPFIVAGVPLAAALLLMGVYYLILRAGAM